MQSTSSTSLVAGDRAGAVGNSAHRRHHGTAGAAGRAATRQHPELSRSPGSPRRGAAVRVGSRADAGALERVLQAVDVPADARSSLIEHFTRSIRGVARMHRLRAHDVEDVVQTTWLRLLEHHDRIRDPAALGAWLHTTARRESLRILRDGARVLPVVDEQLDARDPARTAQDRVEERERVAALVHAIGALPVRQRRLMAALLADAELSYTDLSRTLQMPIGSIGPTRARCLQRLRDDPRLSGVAAVA